MEVDGDRLFVVHRPEVLRKVRDRLAALRDEARKEGSQVLTRVKILNLSPEDVRQALRTCLLQAPGDGEALPVSVKQARELYTCCERKGAVLSCPTLLTFDGQRANVMSVTQHAYVKDFTALVTDDSEAYDPNIGELQTGVVFECEGSLPDPDTLRMSLALKVSDLLKMRRMKTPQGEVDIPEVREGRIQGQWSQGQQGQVLLVGDSWEPGKKLLLLVDCTVLTREDLEPSARAVNPPGRTGP